MIQMLDLTAQYAAIRNEIDDAIRRVVDRQKFILGEEVAALEAEVAQYCGTPYAVGVASGTDALILSLKAAGVGPGDEVIVPAFSFVATADSVSLIGATPVFADIDPLTLCIDPASAESLISNRTAAIVPVHLYGQPAAMSEILRIATHHGLVVIGDTAQALGATYHDAPVAGLGEFGCLSFFPGKNLGCYGDGGMIVVRSQQHAERLKMLRSHGSKKRYRSEVQGWNSRLDELQAAILRAKLPHLDQWNSERRSKARLYSELLQGTKDIQLPTVAAGGTSVFHQYTVRVPRRDFVQAELLSAGVQTAIHYPIPLHLQPMFESLGYRRGDLPHAEQASDEVMSLPMYPELQDSQIEHISELLSNAVQTANVVETVY